ncbi:hypothetical protein C2E23DRAFT_824787 [Lenzites betulinus]|nr:hypothetical protein C2E23DRAFT_824787 [Lenzites betulinus]
MGFLVDSRRGSTYSAHPTVSQEPLLAYGGHTSPNGGWHTLEMQQVEYMAPSASGSDSYCGYLETQDPFPSQSWPVVETSDHVVPLFSPWHLPGVESGHNSIKNTNKGAAQGVQHHFGCTSIELCAPNTHVHFNYSQPATAIPHEWSSHDMATGEEFYNSSWDQPKNDWSIPSTQYYQSDICGDLHPQQTMSDFEFMTTVYPEFGEAIQYSEAEFAEELLFQQAGELGFEHMAAAYPGFGEAEFAEELLTQQENSGFEPMAAAYWNFEVSSMAHNGADWNMNTHATDLYSWHVETADINARLACGI